MSSTDRALCATWERRGILLAAVQRAILLGCLRKLIAAVNNPGAGGRISSLRYFAALLDEVQDPSVPESYWQYVEQKLRRVEAGNPRTPEADQRVVYNWADHPDDSVHQQQFRAPALDTNEIPLRPERRVELEAEFEKVRQQQPAHRTA